MIWLIVLAVWLIANVVWNYRIFSRNGFLCVDAMFQGIFAAVPNLVVIFSEWMTEKFEWWTTPIFISKELQDDIDFLNEDLPPEMIIRENGKDIHSTAEQIAKLGNELIEEVKAQAIKQNEAKNETGRKNGKVRKNAKKKN